MTKVWADPTQPMFYMMLLFVLVLCPTAFAEATADNVVQQDCSETICCGLGFFYDPVVGRCRALSVNIVAEATADAGVQQDCGPKCCDFGIYDPVIRMCRVLDRYNVNYAKRYLETEPLYIWIIIAGILFITCASIGALTACIYCCRMNYTDRKLEHDVKALAKKLKRDYQFMKMAPQRPPLPPVSESCSVVVESEGIFVA